MNLWAHTAAALPLSPTQAPYEAVYLLRLILIGLILFVDVAAPNRPNIRIAALCGLWAASTIAAMIGAPIIVTAAISVPFSGLLAWVLINKRRRDPQLIEALLRDVQRQADAERAHLKARIVELEAHIDRLA